MFDPTLPQEHTPADAAQMRAQLNGLKELLDAVPAVTDAVVDAVTTLTPAEPAQATASFELKDYLNAGARHDAHPAPQHAPSHSHLHEAATDEKL